MEKLLIIDGNSMLHRAYYALPDWRNRSGEATAGVYGFLSMMLKAIDELKPTHFVVVFDTPEPTFRHNMYVGYQSTREKERQISEDIWGQVEKLKIVMEKIGVPVFSLGGFEADDLAATITKKAEKDGFEVILITGDKDYMQLVDDEVKLFMPTKGLSDGQVVDRDKVKERLGVWPEQVTDYKALVGDSSDNYPGVAGIGPKTAIGLLEKYGTFEKVIQEALKPKSEISDNVSMKLVNGYEAGELSKRLAMMKDDVPVTIDAQKMKLPDTRMIIETLRELGYRSLIKRMTGVEEKEDVNQQKLFE